MPHLQESARIKNDLNTKIHVKNINDIIWP